jgi:cellulose synthase/poly-beta-1,6-N-acetylglucosamine synthase-like glycosyltransferase
MAIQSSSCLSDQATSQSDHLIFFVFLYFFLYFYIFCIFAFCIPVPFQPGAINIKSRGM